MIRLSMMVAMTLSAAALPSIAYGGQTSGTQSAKQQPDPSEVVCKDIDVSGVRFATKRVCATRAEWQAREQGDRQRVEEMQRPIVTCGMMGSRKC